MSYTVQSLQEMTPEEREVMLLPPVLRVRMAMLALQGWRFRRLRSFWYATMGGCEFSNTTLHDLVYWLDDQLTTEEKHDDTEDAH